MLQITYNYIKWLSPPCIYTKHTRQVSPPLHLSSSSSQTLASSVLVTDGFYHVLEEHRSVGSFPCRLCPSHSRFVCVNY